MNENRFKVVTRVYWGGSVLDTGKGPASSRDTRYLTRDELAEWLRDNQEDAIKYGVTGTVHLDGKEYASFCRAQWSPIPRCPLCEVRHFSRCVSRPTPEECPGHEFTIQLSIPVIAMGMTFGSTPMEECGICAYRRIRES